VKLSAPTSYGPPWDSTALFIMKTPLIGLVDYVNTYVIKADDEDVVIDVGPDLFLSIMALRKNMKRLNVRLNRSLFIVTHAHRDHVGATRKLATASKVYIGHNELRTLMSSEDRAREVLAFAVENGFPECLAKSVVRLMLVTRFKDAPELVPLRDGEVLELGHYKLKCIETPGHTQGHICLYDQNKGILFSGDHVLRDITPNISSWSYEEDALSAYLLSLKRLCELDLAIVLPGHGRPLKDLKRRVRELVDHHEERLLQIIKILKVQSGDAYWVSSKVKWKTQHPSWWRTSIFYRWLAFGETLAHLNFLVRLGLVDRKLVKGKAIYQVVSDNAVEVVKKVIASSFFAAL